MTSWWRGKKGRPEHGSDGRPDDSRFEAFNHVKTGSDAVGLRRIRVPNDGPARRRAIDWWRSRTDRAAAAGSIVKPVVLTASCCCCGSAADRHITAQAARQRPGDGGLTDCAHEVKGRGVWSSGTWQTLEAPGLTRCEAPSTYGRRRPQRAAPAAFSTQRVTASALVSDDPAC